MATQYRVRIVVETRKVPDEDQPYGRPSRWVKFPIVDWRTRPTEDLERVIEQAKAIEAAAELTQTF